MNLAALRASRWLGAGLLVLSESVAAQYKLVGPDGRTTYTDRPAPGARPLDRHAPAAAQAELPYALREPVARYPATLYTAQDCEPCEQARAALRQRGVPLQERTIDRPEDVQALQQQEHAATLPLLRLGRHRLLGFDAAEWQATLDAAGYPRSSVLPPHWRHAPATPLVATPSAPLPAPAAAASAPPLPLHPSPPGGIRF